MFKSHELGLNKPDWGTKINQRNRTTVGYELTKLTPLETMHETGTDSIFQNGTGDKLIPDRRPQDLLCYLQKAELVCG